jgi:YegS/Rv2252/BmrU family lipid kinase
VRILFLVNPASANGTTGREWDELYRRARDLGLQGEVFLSSKPGDLTHAARDADAEQLVVVGGDGSLNEVVNGRRDLPVAMIARGTGMDFVRTHGIPTTLEDAVHVAREGELQTIDLGRVSFREGVRWFANVASVGMSGAVALRANSMSKALGGRVTFYAALVREFLGWRNSEVTVRLEDGISRQGRMHDVIVANGQWHGGGMWLAPEARADDGRFDVVLIGDITKLDFATTSPKLYKGTYLAHPKVEHLRSATVAVDAPVPLPIETDGEVAGTTPARFEIVPQALRVRVP